MDWDEGPFYQSQRTELYQEAAKKCLANGSAFLCYCPPEKYVGGDHAEEGAERREGAAGGALLVPRREAVDAGNEAGGALQGADGRNNEIFRRGVWRAEFSNDEIEDFVLLRSGKEGEEFGQAMYQMSVVADDIDMRITHVIRGADHISNTPKQVLLYRALGAEPPVFAHVPLILGPDKSRLSKRHGATDVNMYRREGFLPEAFRNFLALLGWAPGGDEEFLRTKELLEKFSLEGRKPDERSVRPGEAGMVQHAVSAEAADRGAVAASGSATEAGRFVERRVGDGCRARMVFARPWICCGRECGCCRIFRSWSRAFFSDEFAIDPAAKAKFWKDEKVPESAGEAGGCAGGTARVESRRLRSRFPESGGRGRREGGTADQRDARGDRGASCGAAAVRHDGGAGTGASGETVAGGVERVWEVEEVIRGR